MSFDKEAYHTGTDRLTSSGAKDILRSPAHYLLRYGPKAKKAPPSAAMRFGTASHLLILEGEEVFNRSVAANPGINRRTKAGKAEWEEYLLSRPGLDGDMVFSLEDYDSMFWLRDAVYAHPEAARLLTEGQPEYYYEWTDPETGVPCKAMADYWRGDCIVDLKTCQDGSPEGFAKAVYNFRYHVSAQFYRHGDSVLCGGLKDYFWIAAEKHTNQVGVYTLDRKAEELGYSAVRKALQTYADCKAQGDWWGYSPDAVQLKSPAWAR